MPSVYQLKKDFQSLLRPLVKKLAKAKIVPNQVTISAIILSAAGGLYMALWPQKSWPWLILPLILFLRMALNAIDGMLAREHRMKSKLGGLLNELGDVISDTFLYLPFALIEGIGGLVVVICILSIITEFAGLAAVSIGSSRRYDGPMGKSDRALVFGTLGFLLGLGIKPSTWLDSILIITLILLVVTIYNRCKNALKEAKKNG